MKTFVWSECRGFAGSLMVDNWLRIVLHHWQTQRHPPQDPSASHPGPSRWCSQQPFGPPMVQSRAHRCICLVHDSSWQLVTARVHGKDISISLIPSGDLAWHLVEFRDKLADEFTLEMKHQNTRCCLRRVMLTSPPLGPLHSVMSPSLAPPQWISKITQASPPQGIIWASGRMIHTKKRRRPRCGAR